MVKVSSFVCALAVLAGFFGAADAGESTSANYRLTPATVNHGGGESMSASFTLNASASQSATIGTSSSTGYVLQSGFWSFVGSGLVPVVLTVDRNVITAGNVDLSWSGNNAPYSVYQSTDCANVDAAFYDSTAGNNYDDITPPAADLVCYRVRATAPGPAPPSP